jgi:hypothetical protein
MAKAPSGLRAFTVVSVAISACVKLDGTTRIGVEAHSQRNIGRDIYTPRRRKAPIAMTTAARVSI